VAQTIHIAADDLHDWAEKLLRRAGASAPAAQATAGALVDGNVRGLDSHGVGLLSLYLPRLERGTIRGDAHPQVLIERAGFALVEGNDALGAYVAGFAMGLCCDKAQTAGAAAVAVRRSNHFGAASCYSRQAAERGCVGIVISNTDPGMAPLGAHGPLLGTNPLAVAAPGGAGVLAPSLDIATSVVAQGKLTLAELAGEPIPPDWAIGPDGTATTDPAAGLEGAVLPMAGHKGFGLAVMIDVLAGCLSGANVSPDISAEPDHVQDAGHLFLALDIGTVGDLEGYAASLRGLADRVHGAKRAPFAAPFLMPGEPEARDAEERRRVGIPGERVECSTAATPGGAVLSPISRLVL
jgi:LDH2 family malate/lactate/ureidoglycolate dehydrogenase